MKLKLNIKQGLLYCRQNSVLKFAGGVTRIFIRFNSGGSADSWGWKNNNVQKFIAKKLREEGELAKKVLRGESDNVALNREIKDLTTKVRELGEIRESYNKLLNECLEDSSKLIERYAEVRDRVHNYNYSIDARITPKKLINVVADHDFSSEVNSSRISDFLKIINDGSLSENMQQQLQGIYTFLERFDSSEEITNTPISNRFGVLEPKIIEVLKNVWKPGFKISSVTDKGDSSIYVITFDLIRSKSVGFTLTYNYVEYNSIFAICLIFYLFKQQSATILKNSLEFGASYYFLIDKDVESKYIDEGLLNKFKMERELFDIKDLESLINEKLAVSFIDFIKSISRGELLSVTKEEFYNIIRSAINVTKVKNKKSKGLVELSNYLLNRLDVVFDDYMKIFIEKHKISKWIINPLNRFFYIVDDLDKFKEYMKSVGFGTEKMNQGKQSDRGAVNQLKHKIVLFDQNFRNSMYSQYLHQNYLLNRENFYTCGFDYHLFHYKNISNCNRARSYSTFQRVNSLNINGSSLLNKGCNIIVNIRKYGEIRGNKEIKARKLSAFLQEIETILKESNGNPYKAQFEMESRWNDLTFKMFNIDSGIYRQQHGVIEKGLEVLQLYKDNGNLTRTFKSILDFIVKFENVYLAFSVIISYYKRMGLVGIQMYIGRNILYNIYKKRFKKTFTTFDEFAIAHKIDKAYTVRLGNVFTEIFTIQLNPVFKIWFDTEDDKYILIFNGEFEHELIENLVVVPQSLPMLCRPEEWSKEKFGGLLLNNTEDFMNGLVTGSKQHRHNIRLNDYLYKAVNCLNSKEFMVNSDILEYLSTEGEFIQEHYKEKAYDQYINNQITLSIANVYKNHNFYLNVNIDWRGRIYTQSFYLDYQGSELSLSLINMSKGKSLDESGEFFFYIYGANLYNEDGLNKKTFKERYNWVSNNIENIYSMKKEFILKAESPACFAAFCLNMRKLKENPNYEINMPVFLDATCSGIQHFAAMLLDVGLAKHVNLISSENVNDIYSTLIPKLNGAINTSWLTDVKCYKFKDVELSRALLKRAIMTKAYSVTTYGVTEQLKSKLEKVAKVIIYKGEERVVYDYKVPARNEDGYVILDQIEIRKLAAIINNNIFSHFPVLNSIYLYLTNMTKILVKLELPITWQTPNGLILRQRYNLSERLPITINLLGKNKTAILKNWLQKDDTKRDVSSIIPNIIHSLDASHLISVVNNWDPTKYILPIHDCFGTHPNDMDSLASLVRLEFVTIYSKEDFLKSLDEKFHNELKSYKVEIINVKGVKKVKIKKGKLVLPVLPKPGELKLTDILERSSYMIS